MAMGIPLPLFQTRTKFSSGLMVTSIRFMVGSRCLLSAALTMISSKILYKPGTNEQFLLTNCFVCASNTHINWVCFSTEPMYVSGRNKICSNCVFFVYVSSIVLAFFGDFFTPPAFCCEGAAFSSR